MGDGDDIHYVKKQKTIHYGSLEQSLRAPSSAITAATAAASATPGTSGSTAVTVTFSGPNINTHNKYFEITQDGMTVERQSALEEFERKRKARQIAVSTDDIEVRAHLRHLNHPMCE